MAAYAASSLACLVCGAAGYSLGVRRESGGTSAVATTTNVTPPVGTVATAPAVSDAVVTGEASTLPAAPPHLLGATSSAVTVATSSSDSDASAAACGPIRMWIHAAWLGFATATIVYRWAALSRHRRPERSSSPPTRSSASARHVTAAADGATAVVGGASTVHAAAHPPPPPPPSTEVCHTPPPETVALYTPPVPRSSSWSPPAAANGSTITADHSDAAAVRAVRTVSHEGGGGSHLHATPTHEDSPVTASVMQVSPHSHVNTAAPSSHRGISTVLDSDAALASRELLPTTASSASSDSMGDVLNGGGGGRGQQGAAAAGAVVPPHPLRDVLPIVSIAPGVPSPLLSAHPPSPSPDQPLPRIRTAEPSESPAAAVGAPNVRGASDPLLAVPLAGHQKAPPASTVGGSSWGIAPGVPSPLSSAFPPSPAPPDETVVPIIVCTDPSGSPTAADGCASRASRDSMPTPTASTSSSSAGSSCSSIAEAIAEGGRKPPSLPNGASDEMAANSMAPGVPSPLLSAFPPSPALPPGDVSTSLGDGVAADQGTTTPSHSAGVAAAASWVARVSIPGHSGYSTGGGGGGGGAATGVHPLLGKSAPSSSQLDGLTAATTTPSMHSSVDGAMDLEDDEDENPVEVEGSGPPLPPSRLESAYPTSPGPTPPFGHSADPILHQDVVANLRGWMPVSRLTTTVVGFDRVMETKPPRLESAFPASPTASEGRGAGDDYTHYAHQSQHDCLPTHPQRIPTAASGEEVSPLGSGTPRSEAPFAAAQEATQECDPLSTAPPPPAPHLTTMRGGRGGPDTDVVGTTPPCPLALARAFPESLPASPKCPPPTDNSLSAAASTCNRDQAGSTSETETTMPGTSPHHCPPPPAERAVPADVPPSDSHPDATAEGSSERRSSSTAASTATSMSRTSSAASGGSAARARSNTLHVLQQQRTHDALLARLRRSSEPVALAIVSRDASDFDCQSTIAVSAKYGVGVTALPKDLWKRTVLGLQPQGSGTPEFAPQIPGSPTATARATWLAYCSRAQTYVRLAPLTMGEGFVAAMPTGLLTTHRLQGRGGYAGNSADPLPPASNTAFDATDLAHQLRGLLTLDDVDAVGTVAVQPPPPVVTLDIPAPVERGGTANASRRAHAVLVAVHREQVSGATSLLDFAHPPNAVYCFDASSAAVPRAGGLPRAASPNTTVAASVTTPSTGHPTAAATVSSGSGRFSEARSDAFDEESRSTFDFCDVHVHAASASTHNAMPLSAIANAVLYDRLLKMRRDVIRRSMLPVGV